MLHVPTLQVVRVVQRPMKTDNFWKSRPSLPVSNQLMPIHNVVSNVPEGFVSVVTSPYAASLEDLTGLIHEPLLRDIASQLVNGLGDL